MEKMNEGLLPERYRLTVAF